MVLLYGPNGSGKTSFCEGLEFGLLGSVEEAETKRIDGRTYLANLHARRFEAPALRATDHQNREVAVDANADTFRFCFIEKNRIDAFSRIAARPPAQRTELIATLFGMEKFNEFVGHFNESIDAQLVTYAAKQLALTTKRNTLANDQAAVTGEAQSLLDLAAEEAALAAAHQEGMAYEGLTAFIGTAEAPGRLKELDGILGALPPAAIGVSRDGLLGAFEAPRAAQEEHAGIAAKLEERSSQVSFKDLYTAVLALQATQGDHCPACDTPLADAKSNPFEKATAGLADLKELGGLQEQREAAQRKVGTASRELRRQLGSLSAFLAAQEGQDTPVDRFLAGLAAEPAGEWWSAVYPARPPQEGEDANAVTFDAILAVANRIAAQDAASALARQERQRHATERADLVALQLAIQAHDLKRKQLVDGVAAARGRIAAFNMDNAQLIADVAQEALDIRETIFESDHFAVTQLIVTCHSNEFIKDIQQHLPAARREDCKVYLFRNHTGDYQPRVSGNVTTRNYVANARASKDNLDHRAALTSCRQGLEMLSEKVWRWLGSHGQGLLSIQLAGSGAEPGLRNLCDALRKRLEDATTFEHPNKPALLAGYGRILGVPAANLVWPNLNKGTHEEADRDDFDADLVEFIVRTLEEIDALDLRAGR